MSVTNDTIEKTTEALLDRATWYEQPNDYRAGVLALADLLVLHLETPSRAQENTS